MSAALVLSMTPGLAMFYGGMVRSKNVLAVMMNNLIAMGAVSVVWAVVAASLAFGSDAGGGLIGNLSLSELSGLSHSLPRFAYRGASSLAIITFEMMFAVITAVLISGGTTDPHQVLGVPALRGAWVLLVYAPLAHWVFSPEGAWPAPGSSTSPVRRWRRSTRVLHPRRRRGPWPASGLTWREHGSPLGAAQSERHRDLVVRWFGFNAGSALGVNDAAVHAFVDTLLAAAAGLLGWLVFEKNKEAYPTTLGAASGAVAGMVAITPCAGFVTSMIAILIGVVAGVACAAAVRLKFLWRYDDALDVPGVHGVGGLIGMVLLGLFASRSVNPLGSNGLITGGNGHFFGVALLAAAGPPPSPSP